MIGIAHVHAIRREEIRRVLEKHNGLFASKDLLEIGSGTGIQLKILAEICKSVVGMEVGDSFYAPHRVADIREYDGKSIPFPDRSFDVIFSSHVLEHIKEEGTIHREMHRVLRPGGVSIHVVPTHTWRLWNSLVHYPASPAFITDKLVQWRNGSQPGGRAHSAKPHWGMRLLNILTPPRHGESGNRISEHWLFHPRAWRRRLEAQGWRVDSLEGLGLAYTGHSFLGSRVSMKTRGRWSRALGSSSIVIVARPR